ncbi:MAG: FKBP-type peptidyl-prolyl cis-trans isomerase, partial [Bacteroidales bacterium]|nr:FKBP-type peptidyl-prolyl cis-trans isomerase [Bacteroidales bacterium]
ILTMNIKWRLVINKKDSVLNITPNPFEIKLMKLEFKGDVYEALGILHKGDSATFIINAKDFFLKTAKYPQLPEGIDSTTMLYFDVKLLNVETMEQRQKAEMAKAEKFKTEEPAKIQAYLTKNKVTVSPSDSGIYIIVQNPGSGRGIVKTDFVKINLTVSSIEGKKIFSTLDQNQPISFEYGKPFDTKGFDLAIATMKKGSKATVVIPSAMGFGEQGRKDQSGQDIFAPYSPVVYDIEVLDLKTKAENDKAVKLEEAIKKKEEAIKKKAAAEALVKEPNLIQQYLKDNKITAKPTASGLYYIEKVAGKGAKAKAGDKVKVHYTGKLLNGKVFDSSLTRKPVAPFEFTIGQGQVIPGWDEGIAMMSAGAKATILVPSKLGYGERGAGEDIPAYSPLVFDVELISINAK